MCLNLRIHRKVNLLISIKGLIHSVQKTVYYTTSQMVKNTFLRQKEAMPSNKNSINNSIEQMPSEVPSRLHTLPLTVLVHHYLTFAFIVYSFFFFTPISKFKLQTTPTITRSLCSYWVLGSNERTQILKWARNKRIINRRSLENTAHHSTQWVT